MSFKLRLTRAAEVLSWQLLGFTLLACGWVLSAVWCASTLNNAAESFESFHLCYNPGRSWPRPIVSFDTSGEAVVIENQNGEIGDFASMFEVLESTSKQVMVAGVTEYFCAFGLPSPLLIFTDHGRMNVCAIDAM